ncbi:MAG: nuclear transport factor 2 family protein [Candidatus Thiodiazotropha sp. (ex Ctena orbiculata)]|nr:nuclear transport factor 2 family protein [Candidatus Thiodiazotropha taylori]
MTTQITDIKLSFGSIVENFERSFKQGNMADLAAFYSDNAMLLPSGSDVIEGRQAIEAYWQHAIDMGIKSIRIDLMELEQHGDSATEVSHYTMFDGEESVVDQGKGIMIWKYDGSAWKMHRDIWTSNSAY